MQLPQNTVLKNNCYRIIEFIGQGGFGITYLGEEIGYIKSTGFGEEWVANKTPEKVVIKELYFDDICNRNEATGIVNISNSDKRVQFEKLVYKQLEEGKILKRLNNPYIVKTKDIFKENNTAYMVMDYVDSMNLNDVISKAGRLDKTNALKYLKQILNAVIYIHNQDPKILHLDISPSNILINENDDAILIDFGASLSYTTSDKIASTTSNLVTGRKANYAPVEQNDLDNLKEFDATLDTYALGATLYHALTGIIPPPSSLLSSQRQNLIPPSVATHSPEISDYLDTVVIKAMNPKYHNRYKTAAELNEALNKEPNYTKQLDLLAKQVAENKYEEALHTIEQAEDLFFSTPTLTNWRKIANTAINQRETEKQFQNIWLQAEELYNKNNYQEAITLYQKIVQQYPERNNAVIKIQNCEEKITQAEANNQEFNILIKQGNTSFENANFETAIQFFKTAQTIFPNNLNLATRIKEAQIKIDASKIKTLLITPINNDLEKRLLSVEKQLINWQNETVYTSTNIDEEIHFQETRGKKLNNIGQHIDELKNYCVRIELENDSTYHLRLQKLIQNYEAEKQKHANTFQELINKGNTNTPPKENIKILEIENEFNRYKNETTLIPTNNKEEEYFWNARKQKLSSISAKLSQWKTQGINVSNNEIEKMDLLSVEFNNELQKVNEQLCKFVKPPVPPIKYEKKKLSKILPLLAFSGILIFATIYFSTRKSDNKIKYASPENNYKNYMDQIKKSNADTLKLTNTYLKPAADSNFHDAIVDYAKFLMAQKKLDLALYYLNKSSLKDTAIIKLKAYAWQEISPKDKKDSILWAFSFCAEHGDPESMFQLGYIYYPNEKSTAAMWFQKAEKCCSFAKAETMLGTMYLNGEGGFALSIDKAFDFYQKAAIKREGMAYYGIGYLYEDVFQGTKKNLDSAKKYLNLAIVSDNETAQNAAKIEIKKINSK